MRPDSKTLRPLRSALRRLPALPLATLVATACLAGAPASALAAQKGVETDMTWGTTNEEQQHAARDVADLRAGWVRLTMSWYWLEPTRGSWDPGVLDMYDRAVARAKAAGAKIVVTVYQSPQWASGSTNPEAAPLHPTEYRDFLRFLADRYHGQVDAWEVWNEENFKRFWPAGPNAAQYVSLLKAGHAAVKSVDPATPVVFGGLAFNDYRYLEDAYLAEPNLGDYFDVMAVHPYTFPAAPEEVWRDDSGRIAKDSFAGYREVRATLLAHGDDRPLWFTEFGWSSNTTSTGVTEQVQADYLTRAFKCVEQDPYVKVAIWYELRNNYWALDANTWEDQLGLVRTDFSHKPAYAAFKAYTPGSDGCSYSDPRSPVPPTRTGSPPSTPTTSDPPALPAPATQPATNPARTSVTLRIVRLARAANARRRAARRRLLAIVGRVRGGRGGRIVLRLERRRGRRWVRGAVYRLRVDGSGRFRRTARNLRGGVWRVRAYYVPPRAGGSRSRLVYFRV